MDRFKFNYVTTLTLPKELQLDLLVVSEQMTNGNVTFTVLLMGSTQFIPNFII